MALSARNVTFPARLSYAHLFEPYKAPNSEGDPKYSAVFLIPKNDTQTLQHIQAAINAAVQDGVERRVFKQAIDPQMLKYPPLRDGDAPKDDGESRGEAFAGHWYISAKASQTNPPKIVDHQVQPVLNRDEVYSGCYVNAAIQFYAYENSGNKGITASLVAVQKAADGERLGGGAPSAEEVFQVIATPSTTPAATQSQGLGF